MNEHADNLTPTTTEILLGRLVDGEASDADRAAFEEAAAQDPGLWRELARAHELAADLTAAVAAEVAAIGHIPLPVAERSPATELDPAAELERARAATLTNRSRAGDDGVLRKLLLVGGWLAAAAALAFALVTSLPQLRGTGEARLTNVDPDLLLDAYREAEWVEGELLPMIMGVEELPNGKLRIRYMRRIEETGVFDGSEPPEDEAGQLTVDPATLH